MGTSGAGTGVHRRLEEIVSVGAGELLTADELIRMGEVIFWLLSNWGRWLEPRIETVRFLDADTVSRRVSVDFILPELPTPLRSVRYLDPARAVATRDTRYLPGGGRTDDPATAY
jgi:hypothetical protein